MDLSSEFSALQQIERVEEEEWSRSPERITKGYPSAFPGKDEEEKEGQERRGGRGRRKREKSSLTTLDWRILTLESMQDRKREEMERRRHRYHESIAKRRANKVERDRLIQENAAHQKIETKKNVDQLWLNKQEMLRHNFERRSKHREAVQGRRQQKEAHHLERNLKATRSTHDRLQEHKYEINWRKKKLHQNALFLDLTSALHEESKA